MSEDLATPYYGVIGAGSFGTAVANLLAQNVKVLLFSRNPEIVEQINHSRRHFGVEIHPNVRAISNLQELAENCYTIFPIVPSNSFRKMMRAIGPFLRPYHILIHGTKGFDIHGIEENDIGVEKLIPAHVHTMSQVILQESSVRRVGCLAGPNLASEIMEGQPTATVVSSRYSEVVEIGKKVLTSPQFHVFGSHDILGSELAGALKNMIAIGSGILRGRGLGKNIQAMLITRGLTEMVHFGNTFGSEKSAFFGTSGVGDLIATATSKASRNFTFGYRLGKGEDFETIQNSMPELAEGVRTINIAYHLAKSVRLRVPITQMLYQVVFQQYNIDEAIQYLMSYPYDIDIDFF